MRLDTIRSIDLDHQILGQTRRVTYGDGALTIHGLPAALLAQALAALSGEAQVRTHTPTPTLAPVAPAASPEVAAIVAAAYAPPVDDPALEFPPRGASMTIPTEPAPVLTAQEIASAPAPYATTEPVPSGGVADTLRNATKLAEVVGYLVEQQGIRELDALVAECQRLAPEVPLLGKIANLPSRIERTLSVLGLA